MALAVMDPSAFLLARGHGIPIHVFTSNRPGAMLDICEGGNVGMYIGPESKIVLAAPFGDARQ